MAVLHFSTHMFWWLSYFYQFTYIDNCLGSKHQLSNYFSQLTYIDDCPSSLNSQALMTVLLLSTHIHWWLSFSQLTRIDDCPTSLNSQALMTVLLLSTHIHWWLSYFSQLTCIDDCSTSLNSHTLMTVLLFSTHMYWWLFYFSQLTCIARWPACRPSPCVTSAGRSASGSSPTCCPPPHLSIRHSAARAQHETCPDNFGIRI